MEVIDGMATLWRRAWRSLAGFLGLGTLLRPTEPLRSLHCYGKYNVLYHAVRIEAAVLRTRRANLLKIPRTAFANQADPDTATMSPDLHHACVNWHLQRLLGDVALWQDDRLIEVYHCDRSSQQATDFVQRSPYEEQFEMLLRLRLWQLPEPRRAMSR